MSAGPFVISGYETDKGADLMPIRVQPETLLLTIGGVANAAPVGTISDAYGSARVGGGKFQNGLKARYVRIKFTAPLAGYKADAAITLPVLDKAVWAGYSKGDVGTYLATAIIVVGVPQPESRA